MDFRVYGFGFIRGFFGLQGLGFWGDRVEIQPNGGKYNHTVENPTEPLLWASPNEKKITIGYCGAFIRLDILCRKPMYSLKVPAPKPGKGGCDSSNDDDDATTATTTSQRVRAPLLPLQVQRLPVRAESRPQSHDSPNH